MCKLFVDFKDKNINIVNHCDKIINHNFIVIPPIHNVINIAYFMKKRKQHYLPRNVNSSKQNGVAVNKINKPHKTLPFSKKYS